MTVRTIRADRARKALRAAGGTDGNLRVCKACYNGGIGRRANQEGIIAGHLHRQPFERLGGPVADEQPHLDVFSRIRNAVPVAEDTVLDEVIGDLDRGLSLIPGPEYPVLAVLQHVPLLVSPNARAWLETDPVPTASLGCVVHQREDDRIICVAIYVKTSANDQLAAVRIGSLPAAIRIRKRHHRARIERQCRASVHDDVAAYVDPAAPHRLSDDVSLPFWKPDIHHHIRADSSDRFDEQSRGSRAEFSLVVRAIRIGMRRERGKAHPVEGIRGIPQIALVPGAIRFVVRPEIQIVRSGIGIGRCAVRIPRVVEASIRTLQIQSLRAVQKKGIMGHVPDQQAISGDISVVVTQRGLPVLQQKIFVLADGNLEDFPRGRHVRDHEVGYVVRDLHYVRPS